MATGDEVLERLAELVAQKSGSTFYRNMSDKDTGNREELLKMDEQAKAMKKIASRIDAMGVKYFESKQELDKELTVLSKIAEKAGLTLEEMGIKGTRRYNLALKKSEYFINNQANAAEKLTKRSEELSEAFEEANEEVRTSRLNFAKLGEIVKNIGKDFLRLGEQEARFAMQTATADAGWIAGIEQMGIAQIDYMRLLKETRVEGLAATSAGVNFKESLIKSQKSLVGLTASTTEAAKVSGLFHRNMARIGVSQDELGDAVAQQTKIYTENYRALGYTAEEFANLTTELINDQGMRDVLLTLQEKERKAYVLGIQQRMAEYQTMGYTIERAKELQRTFQNLVGMDPKERMKQAAKKRAMLGAMGMGGEAAELFDLEIRYRTMTAEQKKDADIRMAEIQQQGAKVFGEMSGAGSSLGQSMAMQMMAQKTGFDKVAQTFEVESGQGLKIEKDQLGVLHEISGTIKGMITSLDYWNALSNSALGSIVPNLLKGLGGLLALYMGKKLLGKMGGRFGIGSTAKRFGGNIANFAKGSATTIARLAIPAAAVVASGTVGYKLGTAINDKLSEKTKENIGEAIGPAIDHVLSWFGNKEAEHRLKLRSEIKSKEPTMISDPKKEAVEPAAKAKKEMAAAEVEIKAAADKKREVREAMEQGAKLLSTLQEIETYLKTLNEQNMEQALAVSKTADAVVEGIRFNAISDRRPGS